MANAAKAPVVKIKQDKLPRTISYRKADKLVWAEWVKHIFTCNVSCFFCVEKPFFHPGRYSCSPVNAFLNIKLTVTR